MLPDPLHPAIVHFPVVLVMLLPIFAVATLWAIRRGASPVRAWAVPVALAAALAGSAWLATETGQAQEDRVERVVGEQPIHAHEENAERFLVLSGVLLLVAGAGLLGGRIGRVSRVAATVGAFGLVIAGIQVGTTGGELVYRHGAARAYVTAGAGVAGSAPGAPAEARGGERYDDD